MEMEKQASWWDRLKFLAVAGGGLLADGYLNLSIGLIIPMLGHIYFQDSDGKIDTTKGDVIKGSLSLGMIVGQVAFGILGDAIGRHNVYGRELIFTMFGTLMCVLLPWKGLSHDAIITWMSVWRVVTGFGIGGDYPMSSSLAAEKPAFGSRAKMILSVFTCIGVGSCCSSIVFLILLAAFKGMIQEDIKNVEWVWRLLLGLGLVPCALTCYSRLVMKETKPYEKYVLKQSDDDAHPPPTRGLLQQFRDVRVYFAERRHAQALFSVCAVWFLFDIAYYGINLNQANILARIGYSKGATPYDTLWKTAVGNVIVQMAGYLPGFFVGIFLPDTIGRKRQQLYLCALGACLYAIWAGVTHHTSTGGLITIFTISQLVLNAGPNMTTFLLPVELFPTRVRATAHGIAAASGKIGAVLTAFTFGTAAEVIGIEGVLGLLSGIMALCVACTFLIPETKGSTLDDLENDTIYGARPEPDSSVEEVGKVAKVPESVAFSMESKA